MAILFSQMEEATRSPDAWPLVSGDRFMSSNCCGCVSSCPEAAAVTINVTEIEWDGSEASFRTARFSRAAGTVTADSGGAYRVISLPYAVAMPDSVTVARNSGVQRPGVDFAVSGSQIYLTAEAGVDDEFLVNWFSSQAQPAVGGYGTGHIAGFASSPGAAWLAMDGTTTHSAAAYQALWVYLTANPGLMESFDSTSFVLKAASFSLYTGSELLALQGYIHV